MPLPFRGRTRAPADRAYPPPRPSLAEARRQLELAVQAGSAADVARATCDLGVALSDAGDEAGARAAWNQVVDTGDAEEASRALRNLAIAARTAEDFERARDLLRRALTLGHPVWSRDAALDLADMLEQDGERTGAADILAPVVDWAAAGPPAPVQFVRGRWLELQGDTAAATAVYEEILTQAEQWRTSRAALRLAAIYGTSGDAQATERVLLRAIELLVLEQDEHLESHARVQLGRLLIRRQDRRRARAELERAIVVGCPAARAESHYWLGQMYLIGADRTVSTGRGNKLAQEAVSEFQHALEQGHAKFSVDIRTGLGYAYELLDELAAARATYQQAVEDASPERRERVQLALAQFMVRHQLWAEADPLLCSLAESTAPDIADPARKLREQRPR